MSVTRAAKEWAEDAVFEWLLTDPVPTRPGIETPSEHETRQRTMLVAIIAQKMEGYAAQQREQEKR